MGNGIQSPPEYAAEIIYEAATDGTNQLRYIVGEETGLSIHTLRYYEKEGILPAVKRSENGIRIFEEEDIEWLKFACCLRDTGMTILEMKEFA